MIGKTLKPASVMLWSNDRVIILNCRLNERKLQVLRFFDIYLTIVLASTILIGMLAPISEVSTAPAGTDKIIHILAFAAMVSPLALTRRIGLFRLFIFATLFGGMIEILQPSFGRNADIIDWLADIFGISCGIGITRLSIAVGLRIKISPNGPQRKKANTWMGDKSGFYEKFKNYKSF